MFSREFAFCLFISYARICTWIVQHLKETVLWVTSHGLEKQNVLQASMRKNCYPWKRASSLNIDIQHHFEVSLLEIT